MDEKRAMMLWTTVLGLALLLCASAAQAQMNTYNGQIVWSEDFEDFEADWGDWYTDMGVWQIGEPTAGPSSVPSGQAVAATDLSGDYAADTDSRLISPVLTLPVVTGDERLELRYQQWYSYDSGDVGHIQVSEWDGGKWGGWMTVFTPTASDFYSDWSVVAVDLTAYAGQMVQIAFHHTAQNIFREAGWYIDDVTVWRGVPSFTNPETFEFGWGDWHTDKGIWQIGTPTSGPGAAHGGTCVAGTHLTGDYAVDTDSRLISPVLTLPTVTGDERVELRYLQWYAYDSGDVGHIQVSECDGGTWGEWMTVHTPTASDFHSDWSLVAVDLTPYAGREVRIAFYHTAQNIFREAGWYIDDVTMWRGAPVFTNPETFEFGWGDWHTDKGVWQIGIPGSGPDAAHGGTCVVGTHLAGDYAVDTDSRLISQAVILPVSPSLKLRYWQWYSYDSGDVGYVQVSEWDGGQWGEWMTVHTPTASDFHSDWSVVAVDLTSYAGQLVRIAFYHTAKNIFREAGWYIDDVQITPPPETWMVSEDTGISRTDKLTNDTTPELTFVFPHDVYGQDSDIEIIDPEGDKFGPDSISGWGTNTVVAGITTPLTKNGTYVVVLMGMITDAQGTPINNGTIKILPFTLDTLPPLVTFDVEVTPDGAVVLTGTIDDPDATVEVIFEDQAVLARNNGDGTWILPVDMINPAPAGSIYDANVVATDWAGNVGSPNDCKLVLSSSEGGAITESGEGLFVVDCNEIVVVEAAADDGSQFVGWEGTAWDAGKVTVISQDDSGSTAEVLVDGVYTLTAVFEPLCCLTLGVIGQGSIDLDVGEHYYACGTTVEVCATAEAGYEFVRWEGTAVSEGASTEPCISVELDGGDGCDTLTAVFETVIYDEPLDADPGWVLEGQWEFGPPTGQRCSGWGNVDPTSGHTGQNVIGVNLEGCYDLAIGGPYSAIAGPFDLSGYEDITLRFWRWLNSDIPEYVRSTVEVSTDGQTWSVVWEQAEREEITDTEWTLCEYCLPQADLEPTVYVRWTYEIVQERAYAYTSWNLDDIQWVGMPQ